MATTHLFLEGPSGSGKTTLLLEEMGPMRLQAGGFVVRRLTEGKGTRAFSLSAPRLSSSPSLPFSPEIPDAFIQRGAKGLECRREVFLEAGLRLLRDAEERRLILLDEIGGCELLVPEFRARLFEILAGDVPCLGVFKAPSNALHTSQGLNLAPAFGVVYRNFRARLLSDPRVTLLEMTAQTREEAQRRVRKFLEDISRDERSEISG